MRIKVIEEESTMQQENKKFMGIEPNCFKRVHLMAKSIRDKINEESLLKKGKIKGVLR